MGVNSLVNIMHRKGANFYMSFDLKYFLSNISRLKVKHLLGANEYGYAFAASGQTFEGGELYESTMGAEGDP